MLDVLEANDDQQQSSGHVLQWQPVDHGQWLLVRRRGVSGVRRQSYTSSTNASSADADELAHAGADQMP